MQPFPDEHELLGFFECEPKVTDRDVPWFYNRLSFIYKSGDDTIACSIEPGYGQIDLTWRRSGEELASFALRRVAALFVKGAPGQEYLTAQFMGEDVRDFFLYTKPRIRIEWGTYDPDAA